jgi:hypothetical protein
MPCAGSSEEARLAPRVIVTDGLPELACPRGRRGHDREAERLGRLELRHRPPRPTLPQSGPAAPFGLRGHDVVLARGRCASVSGLAIGPSPGSDRLARRPGSDAGRSRGARLLGALGDCHASPISRRSFQASMSRSRSTRSKSSLRTSPSWGSGIRTRGRIPLRASSRSLRSLRPRYAAAPCRSRTRGCSGASETRPGVLHDGAGPGPGAAPARRGGAPAGRARAASSRGGRPGLPRSRTEAAARGSGCPPPPRPFSVSAWPSPEATP